MSTHLSPFHSLKPPSGNLHKTPLKSRCAPLSLPSLSSSLALLPLFELFLEYECARMRVCVLSARSADADGFAQLCELNFNSCFFVVVVVGAGAGWQRPHGIHTHRHTHVAVIRIGKFNKLSVVGGLCPPSLSLPLSMCDWSLLAIAKQFHSSQLCPQLINKLIIEFATLCSAAAAAAPRRSINFALIFFTRQNLQLIYLLCPMLMLLLLLPNWYRRMNLSRPPDNSNKMNA